MSNVTYPLLAGTNVSSDFVELPSQLYEHWLEVPEILQKYALHAKTGEPMPKALLDRLLATRTFNQGFGTVEYTACALVDLDIHSLIDTRALDVSDFERKTLGALHMPAEIVMRHRLPHFGHLFSGGGYAAGYYSYMWSEVLDADAFEAFEETGNAFDPETAKRLRCCCNRCEFLLSIDIFLTPTLLLHVQMLLSAALRRHMGLADARGNALWRLVGLGGAFGFILRVIGLR